MAAEVPRQGPLGWWDRLVGPGATGAELALQLGTALVAAVAAPLHALALGSDWSTAQYIVCVVLAFDIAGGVVSNATSCAKRWYHREGRGRLGHLGFVAAHVLHLALVAWVFTGVGPGFVLVAGGALLVCAVAIVSSPLYLQRPVALLLFACCLLGSHYLWEPPAGLGWFLPLFFLKLLVSHLPKEKAYAPRSGVGKL